MVWSAVIGAASSLLGGALNRSSAENVNKSAQDVANANFRQQMLSARHGLTWRAHDVMDAYKQTGIHPLAMLGVQGATYSPVSAAFTPSGVGDSVARAGQDISRSISAGADRALRERQLEMQEVQMNNMAERGQLENEALRLQITSQRMRLAQMSMPGVPGESVNFPGVEKKVIPDVTLVRTPRGGYVVLPSEAAQQRMEEIFGLGPEWFARNRAWLATPEARDWVKKFLPAPGYSRQWEYNAPTGEWLEGYQRYSDRHLPAIRNNRYVSRGRQMMRVYDR